MCAVRAPAGRCARRRRAGGVDARGRGPPTESPRLTGRTWRTSYGSPLAAKRVPDRPGPTGSDVGAEEPASGASCPRWSSDRPSWGVVKLRRAGNSASATGRPPPPVGGRPVAARGSCALVTGPGRWSSQPSLSWSAGSHRRHSTSSPGQMPGASGASRTSSAGHARGRPGARRSSPAPPWVAQPAVLRPARTVASPGLDGPSGGDLTSASTAAGCLAAVPAPTAWVPGSLGWADAASSPGRCRVSPVASSRCGAGTEVMRDAGDCPGRR